MTTEDNLVAKRVVHVLEFVLGNTNTPFRFIGFEAAGYPPTRVDIYKATDFGSRENAQAYIEEHLSDMVWPVHYRCIELTAVYIQQES